MNFPTTVRKALKCSFERWLICSTRSISGKRRLTNMIKFFDLFSGISGFRSGLEAVGNMECVGFCEKDKYAIQAYKALYNTENEVYFNDATTIDTNKLPRFNLLTAGFPCQPFSVAGQRGGFDDERGNLFFEIARILKDKRPEFFILENVPGLLSHKGGETCKKIFETLSDLGYSFKWDIYNSAAFGVPQQRKRLYIVGYIEPRCAGEIFPLGENDAESPNQIIGGAQGQRVYSADGTAITQTSSCGGFGGRTGLYFIDLNPDPKLTETARCITARYNGGVSYCQYLGINATLRCVEMFRFLESGSYHLF